MVWLIVLAAFCIGAVCIWLWQVVKAAIKPIEFKVLCPICDGICGVNVADDGEPSDWHDCDFCDATGIVDLSKAAEYAASR